MIFIGIDPGKKGAIAVLIENFSEAIKMPLTKDKEFDVIKIFNFLNEKKKQCVDTYCCIEKSQAMPGMGVKSMFQYGKGYGFLIAVLKTLNIAFEEIHPRTWKKEFTLTSDKRKSIETAQNLFPLFFKKEEKFLEHDGICEALLIAEFARRKFKIKE